ncbi:MAG: hypothetical protein ACI915_000549 [Gammaproteobacteria bacterium]|jgi:hypothetical protein
MVVYRLFNVTGDRNPGAIRYRPAFVAHQAKDQPASMQPRPQALIPVVKQPTHGNRNLFIESPRFVYRPEVVLG